METPKNTPKPLLPNTPKELAEYYFRQEECLKAPKNGAENPLSDILACVDALREGGDAEIQRLVLQKRKEALLGKYK